MVNQFYFNTVFINLMYVHLQDRNLSSIYKLNHEVKYTVDYILATLLVISIKTNNRYKLPTNMIRYLNLSEYVLFTKNSIRNIIKKQIISSDDTFLKTYIVIGINNPIVIKELTIIV